MAMMNSATVKDLKLAIEKKVNDMEQSSMGHRHISWWVAFFTATLLILVLIMIPIVHVLILCNSIL